MGRRGIKVFFYGLFMDAAVLAERGVTAMSLRRAYVDDVEIRIGARSTLLDSAGGKVYGMLAVLLPTDLQRLYGAPGFEQYCPEAILARELESEGPKTPALCYNLTEPPTADERNPEYAARLRAVLSELEFPSDYVASIG